MLTQIIARIAAPTFFAILAFAGQNAFANSAAPLQSAVIIAGADVAAEFANANGAAVAIQSAEIADNIARIIIAPADRADDDAAEIVMQAEFVSESLSESVSESNSESDVAAVIPAAGDAATLFAIFAEEGGAPVGYILTIGESFLLYAGIQKPLTAFSRRIDV